MYRNIRWIIALAVLAFSLAAAPDAALASDPDCTEQYSDCIEEAGLLDSPFQEMADVECAAEYAGCVAKKLIAW
ncbi:MAG: hypothetical protein ACOC8B_06545 [Gemmatimonadota bacterium]